MRSMYFTALIWHAVSWSATATSLLSILDRDEDRGEVIYSKCKKRNDWGGRAHGALGLTAAK